MSRPRSPNFLPIEALELRVEALQRRMRRLSGLLAGVFLALGTLFVLASARGRASGSDEFLRVKGLVVEDDQGRARIVLGAPIAELDDRRRKDRTVGLLVLDEDGDDRISVGSPTIAPQTGGQLHQRIAASSGIVINDGEGNERTGYGYLENDSVVLGLDHPDGEGVVLFISPAMGYQGLLVNGARGDGDRQRLFLGTALQTDEASGGVLVLNNEDASRHTMITGVGVQRLPSILVHGDDGEPIDLVERLLGRSEAEKNGADEGEAENEDQKR